MHDNMNNFTASFIGCSMKTEDIENLGPHTFVSNDSPSGRVILESSAFGGIPTFIGDNDQYFIIKYMGKMPKITYQYHFNDTELDTIFEIDPSGDIFGRLTFHPNDDVSIGAAQTILNLATLDNYGTIELNQNNESITSSCFAIHSHIGKTKANTEGEDTYIGISSYSKGARTSILKVMGTGLILGSISKRIVITLNDSTKLESFSMGSLKLFDATVSNEDIILAKGSLYDMLTNLEYEDYSGNIYTFKKMLEHPNKIFNVDSEV